MGDTLGGIIAGIPIPVVLIGAEDRVEEANPAAQALFGAAILGRHHGLSFRHPELVMAIAAARAGQVGRARMITQGETQDRVHEVTVTPVGDRVVLAFEDQSALAQMDQMRRDFVANVSHELRTPLTAMIGFIETLQGPAKEDAPARMRFLAIMAREAERMNRLVRDLLHLSRVEAEERVRPSDEVDLAALTRSTAAVLKPVAEEGGVTIRLEGADQPVPLRADSDQMTQVLSNLIENAVKYGSPPGATVTVRITRETGPRGPLLRLSVADQGEGIDPKHLPRLTERFYRVDSHRSREKGGTGLGLAIVKHIISRHRGRLIIESEKGRGSRFSVLLPLE
jgi:two-component system phosphate regulon sensor histidine kinase PhoR